MSRAGDLRKADAALERALDDHDRAGGALSTAIGNMTRASIELGKAIAARDALRGDR